MRAARFSPASRRKKGRQALHQAELDHGSPMGLEARVLHVPAEPRQSTVSNRFTGQEEQIAVITVVLADRTGPIMFEAWRESAEKLLRDLLQWENEVSDEQGVLIHLERFDVRNETRARQTTMRKLYSTDFTTVKCIPYPSQISIRRADILPHPGLYTSDFNRLTMKPPFHISVTGIVATMKPVTQSNHGVDMQDFRLVDSSGRYVMCKGFGAHAGNALIASGNQIIPPAVSHICYEFQEVSVVSNTTWTIHVRFVYHKDRPCCILVPQGPSLQYSNPIWTGLVLLEYYTVCDI